MKQPSLAVVLLAAATTSALDLNEIIFTDTDAVFAPAESITEVQADSAVTSEQ